MKFLTKTEISAIAHRCNQIPSQNWKVSKITFGDISFYDVVTDGDTEIPFTRQECEFIAHARNDIPKLIQHINSLQMLLLQYEQALGELGYQAEKKII
ncbi:hypothetical protein [Neobacillus sp. LXY-1]|uniref:hypothetical protein n=1 Tax=Neobacillus sp. LXY-1 TaxID=3379133 RepID=UPI003EDECBB0